MKNVLLIETMSSGNDFGVDFPNAINEFCRLTVLTVVGSRLKVADGLKVIEIFPEFWGGDSKIKKLMRYLKSIVALATYVSDRKYEVIHVQSFRNVWAEILTYFIFRPSKTRLIYTAHNALPHERGRFDLWLYKFWYNHVDSIHVLSKNTKNEIVRDLEVPESKIFVTLHGNYERFKEKNINLVGVSAKIKYGIQEGERVVLLFGLLRSYKGIESLIQAAQYVKNNEFKIVIVGGGEVAYVEILRKQVEKSLRSDRILLQHKFLTDMDLASLIYCSDMVVFPYRHISQSGALVLALTYGKPVIANKIDGFIEYIENGRTGLLVDAREPNLLAQAIDDLLDNTEKAIAMGRAAELYARDQLAWNSIAEAVFSNY
jgi:glycosyltransferase involved in cell wall biosynthesis